MSSTNSGPSVTTTPNVVVQAVPAGSTSVPFDPSSVAITGGTIAGVPLESRSVITLPSGSASLAAAIPNTIDRLKRSRAERHMIVVIESDSTAVGLSASGSPIFPQGMLLGGSHILGQAMRTAGLKVNTSVWFGFASFVSGANSIGYADPSVTVGAGWTENVNTSAVGGGFWSNNTTTNKLTFNCDQAVDTCRLIYITNGATTNGTITLDVGGSALYSVLCNVAASTVVTAPIALGKPSLYSINVGKTVAGEQVFPVGVIAWNSREPGISIVGNSASGKSVANAISNSSGFNSPFLYAALQPDLVFIHQILNNLASSTYPADIASLITYAKSSGAADVICYDGPQPAAALANSANFPTIIAAQKAAAAAAGIPYVSLTNYVGANSGLASANYFGDNTGHPSPLGYARWYSALAAPLAQTLASN